MKHFFAAMACIFAFSATTLHAQEVYNAVKESAQRVAVSPASTIDQVRLAQFKLSALAYLWNKSFEMKDEVTDMFLNTKAYYLNEFITIYQVQIALSKNKSQDQLKSVVQVFMETSLAYPQFFDPDTETSEVYLPKEDDTTVLTPFSLDTDWEQAAAVVREKYGE